MTIDDLEINYEIYLIFFIAWKLISKGFSNDFGQVILGVCIAKYQFDFPA